jgi:hypothetical protein
VGPTSGVNSPRQYSPTIGPNETNGLSAKYTKIKTASCGAQLRGLTIVSGWAIVHAPLSFASIPCLEIEKTTKTEKRGSENDRNRPKPGKITRKLKKEARETSQTQRPVKIEPANSTRLTRCPTAIFLGLWHPSSPTCRYTTHLAS